MEFFSIFDNLKPLPFQATNWKGNHTARGAREATQRLCHSHRFCSERDLKKRKMNKRSDALSRRIGIGVAIGERNSILVCI